MRSEVNIRHRWTQENKLCIWNYPSLSFVTSTSQCLSSYWLKKIVWPPSSPKSGSLWLEI